MDGGWIKETLKGVAAWCVCSSGSRGRELQDDAAIYLCFCGFVDQVGGYCWLHALRWGRAKGIRNVEICTDSPIADVMLQKVIRDFMSSVSNFECVFCIKGIPGKLGTVNVMVGLINECCYVSWFKRKIYVGLCEDSADTELFMFIVSKRKKKNSSANVYSHPFTSRDLLLLKQLLLQPGQSTAKSSSIKT